MKNFEDIESHLETIIATAYNILEVDKHEVDEANKVESINKLLTKRDKQLQVLNKIKINKHQLTEGQRNKLRDFFTRFYVIDKKMNNFFAKLSLNYKLALEEIEQHKKAKRAYHAPLSTSKFLDAQITG